MSAARLFVALELPDTVRAGLVRWARDAVGGRARVRVLTAESLHVTLCFLGGRPVEETEAIGATVREVIEDRVPGPIALELGEAVWLPPGRPRVCAAGLVDVSGSGGLEALQAQLAQRLAVGGWYVPEPRPFLPHVTVARLGRDGPRRPPAVARPTNAGVVFAAPAVTLFRSHTGTGGARYEALARVPVV